MLAPYRGACEFAIVRYRKASGNPAVAIAGERNEPDGEPTIGPFRIDSTGQVRPAKAQHTDHDRALASRYPWLRQSREALQSSACGAAPAQKERGLIQLRRSH